MVILLPPELLSKIFLEVQSAYSWSRGITRREPPCRAVSQVCRQWRGVALESSRLWTCLPLERPQWVKACISRSRSSCLEVHTNFIIAADHAQRQSLLLIYPELSRVDCLDLATDIDDDGYLELVAEVFAGLSLHPAPRLRELKLDFSDTYDMDREPLPIPTCLFASQKLVSLETAAFRSCELSLSWSRTLLTPTLRSLTLDQSLAWRNIDKMVQFFEIIPKLEYFHLDVIIPDTRSFNTSTSSKYSYRSAFLPKLDTFNVSIRYIEETSLLAYLSIPPTASLRIHIGESDSDLMGGDEVELTAAINLGTQAVRDHFASATAAGHGYTHLRINPCGVRAPCTNDPCALHANTDPYNPRAFVPAGLAPIALDFGIPEDFPDLLRPAYASIIEQPVFETATTICIQGQLPQEAWSCFERWTAVETLELSKFGGLGALPGFAAAIHRQGFRLFPGLRDLRIVDAIVIEPNEPEHEPGVHVEGEGLQGTDAREFVLAMKELVGYEHFERLSFSRCTVSVQALRATKDILGARVVEESFLRSPEQELKARKDMKRRRTHFIKYGVFPDD